jgi:hypothetical protein
MKHEKHFRRGYLLSGLEVEVMGRDRLSAKGEAFIERQRGHVVQKGDGEEKETEVVTNCNHLSKLEFYRVLSPTIMAENMLKATQSRPAYRW